MASDFGVKAQVTLRAIAAETNSNVAARHTNHWMLEQTSTMASGINVDHPATAKIYDALMDSQALVASIEARTGNLYTPAATVPTTAAPDTKVGTGPVMRSRADSFKLT